jgi:hypothetical protein
MWVRRMFCSLHHIEKFVIKYGRFTSDVICTHITDIILSTMFSKSVNYSEL